MVVSHLSVLNPDYTCITAVPAPSATKYDTDSSLEPIDYTKFLKNSSSISTEKVLSQHESFILI